MVALSTASFRPASCTVARLAAPKATLRPRCRCSTATTTAGTASPRPATGAHPAPAVLQHTEAPPAPQDAQAVSYDSASLHGLRALSAGSKMRAYSAMAASVANAAPVESQAAHPHPVQCPTASWASVGPAIQRQQALSRSSKSRRADAAPAAHVDSQASRRASSAGYPSAADASASPSLRGKSLLAAAVLLRARYPATFDTLGAATCATLDNPAAAHPWLCHLLEAHIEPLSLLAPGGVTALVATDAGLLGFVEVAADAAHSLQRAGRHSEAQATAMAGLQLVCCLRFGRHAGRGPFLPAIRALQRVLEAAACQ